MWLDESGAVGETARRDRSRLQEILQLDPETLCRTILR
jgi:hypothetical protein